MSDRSDVDEAPEQAGYGHPEADWSDSERESGGGREPRGSEHAGDEEQEDEGEPPEPPGAEGGGAAAPAARRDTSCAGDDLDVTWEQPQGGYPAPERPPDRADGRGPTHPIERKDAMKKDEHDDVPGEADPMPDATTGDEGGGSDAEFREERDREGRQPPRKSPDRERKRAG